MPDSLSDTIRRLARERNAVILAHSYQSPEVQDIADFVGDSYGLALRASEVDADVIAFCGVRFMAETAAVLNPQSKVLLPDAGAGCPMADMIDAAQVCELRNAHPGAPVVCYVNTSAAVKAQSTVCCTSSNAVTIVHSLADAEEILFVPDTHLGRFVERRTGHSLVRWGGYCPIHADIPVGSVLAARAEHPEAEVMVHPECPAEVQDLADHVLSTGQMLELVKTTPCREFIVGTEEGILHPLAKAAPKSRFYPVHPLPVCEDMKKITLAKLAESLQTLEPLVTVPPEVAEGARNAIEEMIRRTKAAETDGTRCRAKSTVNRRSARSLRRRR